MSSNHLSAVKTEELMSELFSRYQEVFFLGVGHRNDHVIAQGGVGAIPAVDVRTKFERSTMMAGTLVRTLEKLIGNLKSRFGTPAQSPGPALLPRLAVSGQ